MILSIPNSYYFLRFIIFHVVFILLALKARNSSIFGFKNETDEQALLAIKDLIPVDPFSVLSSWNHSLHFCKWKGVTCSRRRERVTMLDLSSLNLVGSLSPHMGNLTFLRAIHLQNNSFHGAIPQEIGKLYRLRYLQLFNNSLQGNFPTNLSRCLEIRELDLRGNNLGGYIPTELGSLSKLLLLGFYKNNFIGPIPPSLGNLSSLVMISAGFNTLVGNIPWELSLLSNLEFLNLEVNSLSGMVPMALYNISSIKTFVLDGNQLQGKLPPDLGLTLPNLNFFLLGINNFSGSFPPSIANASGLAIFDIGKNSFTGHLPMNFGRLGNLQRLSLYSNQLGNNQPNALSFLVKSLINCTKLQLLELGDNGFTGDFPYSIVNLSTTLTWLNLGTNYISGSIPHEIENLVNLTSLATHENMLTGSIPKSIGKLSKLEGLYIYTTNISGEIPTSIGNITKLVVLNLRNNMLEGSIPATVGDLKSLLKLALPNNLLTGVIPEQIVGLSSTINLLYLDQNQLTGALPANIGTFKNLGKLHIFGNRLTGEIPSSLGNCLMLESLYMNDNLFQGTIPSSFKQLKNIQVMNLADNNLSGQISSFITELSLLRQLNLSNNMFEGEVPTKGVFENISMFSIVGNFNLCGGIQALQLPECQIKDPEKRRKHFPHRIIPLLIILPIVILFACLALILYCLRRSTKQNRSTSLLQDQFPKVSYGELLQATNGFSLTNLIGEGRYGSVYKGILNRGEQVAVKVLNVELRGAITSFLTECETFRNIRHRNLVKIITSCSSNDYKGNDFKALVLEFMPNGSLDGWLHPSPSEQQNDKKLTLLQRLNIAIDVASAVDYLHHHCHKRIVHCDLKPCNVLLDEEFNAHVGDFGLAKFVADTTSETNHSQTSSIGIRGTIGYVPPEYGMGEEVSPQGDSYSYGILLLEIFTGKRSTNSMFTDNVTLRNYVRKALPQKVIEIIDPRIMECEDGSSGTESVCPYNHTKLGVCLTSILQIGILCCAERPEERMDIRNVLMELIVTRNLLLGE